MTELLYVESSLALFTGAFHAGLCHKPAHFFLDLPLHHMETIKKTATPEEDINKVTDTRRQRKKKLSK